jgi:hypothetical protein
MLWVDRSLRSGCGRGCVAVEPAEDAEGAERVPAAWLARGFAERFAERDGESFGIGAIEEPAAVGLAAALDVADSLVHARIGGDGGGAEVVEGAEYVVKVAGWEG